MTNQEQEFVIWAISGLQEQINDLIDQRRRLVSELERMVQQIDDLIKHSEGVAGLHRNGDIATWDDLTDGGRYEDWLLIEPAKELLRHFREMANNHY